MATEPPEADSRARPKSLPRVQLALVCLVHALILGPVAAFAPWELNWFSVLVGALGAGHVVTAALAALRRERALRIAWTALSFYSLGVFALLTWLMATTAAYVSTLYQGIGALVAAGLGAMWAILVLLTVPVSWWGLAVAWAPSRASRARTAQVGVAVCLFAIASALWVGRLAKAEPLRRAASEAAFRRMLEEVLSVGNAESRAVDESLFSAEPAQCAEPIDAARLTLLVAYLDKQKRVKVGCLQAETLFGLRTHLRKRVLERAFSALPMKLDFVTKIHPLATTAPLIDALKVRPGLDGVCGARACFSPWQLVAINAFTTNRPFAAVRDASFGVSPKLLGKRLGGGNGLAGLSRIETASYVADGTGLHELRRLRPERPVVTPAALKAAVTSAERHIVEAQIQSGAFRYTLDPFDGKENTRTVNLPRQAGTTVALCEVGGSSSASRRAIERSLSWLADREYRDGAMSLLSDSPVRASLGDTALPLIALLSCRDVAGPALDQLSIRLGRFLVSMQRPDGSFHPRFDLNTWKPEGTHEAMYSSGQAVLALVLLDTFLSHPAAKDLADPKPIREALDRAMRYYAGPYWKGPLYDFFFLEENWHCLAARAALESHRDDAYERFCLDYVAFKSRLILGRGSADADLVGGYGFGNVFMPHNTATAGFGEALAAAIAVKRARGLPVEDELTLMRHVLGFLLEAQWREGSCFACSREHRVLGGFSEHLASPVIRIDYVQHAMAALGHGSRVLGH